jgi:glycosyltransferase involved in cell wall biosynthesis
MEILHTVEFYEPSIGGAQEVVKQVSETLVKRGHRVTVATTSLSERRSDFINGVRVVGFELTGNAVRGFRGETGRYHEFLLDSRFDLMMNYAAQQWATDLTFPALPRIRYPKVLSPCGFSSLFDPDYRAYFSRLPHILRDYDHLIFHSESNRDVEYVKRLGMTGYSVIPNGAAAREFDVVDPSFRSRYGIPDDLPLLLTVGTHTGTKGHSLATKAFRRARIGEAVLVVVGNVPEERGCFADCRRQALWANLSSRGRKRVLLLSPPRADVVAAFHAADLFVFGSNIECSPIVLFEALASKTPFLTVASGNAAEIAARSGGGIVIPTKTCRNGFAYGTVEAMARAIEYLINHPERRAQMGEAGFRAWRKRFTWEKIATQYEQLYEAVISKQVARQAV